MFSIETDANQVSESVGAVDVILEVKSGGFDRNVTARLTSESGTADDGMRQCVILPIMWQLSSVIMCIFPQGMIFS